MPSDLLSKIREMRGKATKGPWQYDRKEMLLLPSPSKLRDPNGREGWCGEASNRHDGELIVLLVNHLDEIEKALEESDG